ncbi:MAG: DUF1385 domain-containing protein [Synergistaceae bacterium]|jgi:uncharacterized protein YqhQ|nr:DUF1385 domain-containing protein [Synergistaceae bacterium]
MRRIFSFPFALAHIVISLTGRVNESRRIPVGGQAVIEGVLMKGPKHWGLVVRKPDGSMWHNAWLESKWLKRGAWKLPIVRGFASMADMTRVGFRALSVSAEQALGEEENFSALEMTVSVIFAVLMVGGLFIALPVWVSDKIAGYAGVSAVAKNVAEGVTRGLVFIGYVAAVGMWKDIKRVFAYHGAEHKTINAYERGAPMDVGHVAAHSRIHRRCGTSFMIVVVMVSIIVFSFFGRGPIWQRTAARVVLLPVVVGISYEIIRGASKSDTWGKYLIMPALALQFLTTREPDNSMLEVAIKSLEIALDPYATLNAGSASERFVPFEEMNGHQNGNME